MSAIEALRRRHSRRYADLRRIEQLDPATDYDEIYHLVGWREFPFEFFQGTSVAFMRDYGVPTISDLLDRTGRFRKDGQKRYDDTVLVAEEIARDGIDSIRAKDTVRQLNQIHGHYGIPNHEFRYVLATTLVGPVRFINSYGYRRLVPNELAAMAQVTTRLGRLMGIKDLPETYADYERLHDEYEAEHFAYDPANTRVAEASIAIVTRWYPRPVRPLMRRVMLAILDEPLLDALGLPRQPRWFERLVRTAVRLRGRAMRFMPPRKPGDWFTYDASRTYPFGYSLADLGPTDRSPELHANASFVHGTPTKKGA